MSIDPIINDHDSKAPNYDFVDANQAMLDQAQRVQKDIQQSNTDLSDYYKKLHSMNVTAGYAMILLFFILGASNQSSTFMGYFTDKSGVTGDRLSLNGSVTKVGNILNNFTQSNNNNPNNLTQVFGTDTNKLLDELSDAGGNYPDLDPTAADPSMDPSTQNSVFTELQAIRQEFKLGLPYDPTGSDTYYFDPTDPSKIQNFAELQTDLGQQGDVKGSTDAAKLMTDNFGTNTQTTQTASAVLNNDQKTFTSMEQAVQSFLASIAQWWNTQVKNCNNHMTTS